jgi:hypothetical protein
MILTFTHGGNIMKQLIQKSKDDKTRFMWGDNYAI